MRHLDYAILATCGIIALLCVAFLALQSGTTAQISSLLASPDIGTIGGGMAGVLFLLIFGYLNRGDPALVMAMVVFWLLIGIFYLTITFSAGLHLSLPLSTT
jgi:hypothetical protein